MADIYEMKMPGGANLPRLIVLGAVVLLLLIVLFSSFQVVGAGQRGVVFSKLSGIRDVTLDEGLHFKIPFVEEVVLMDVRVQKSQTAAPAASKDLQNVSSTIAVNFHIDPSRAQKVYQEVGVSYKERVIDPAVQEAVKAATAHFTAEELITRRGEVKDAIKTTLIERLVQFHILVDEFSIIDFSFSEEFNRAIEAKQTAEQSALKARRDLDRIKIEADQRITQARAEAEGQRLQRETLTPILLQLRAIEKWDGKLPQVSGGAMPFIDVNSLKTK
ncbi:prohibitin family protein [Candidatus Manganitrophus noduliformans]|uniref:Prohibitin family protein n=1 Tax=Candidatus Manganitrophus noduliformans TaxID=2606439 RepID=A0A7X6DQM8_9BACT|nr:prohibitin family protein [Candidatus Manganitrophus noduliformans]NKE71519.1 prohibitin family protein [Candidatus Manganitrophus noduliformans]